MLRSTTLALAGIFALATLAHADKDPFEGWTPQQLKVKVLQLQKENKELKDKLAAAPAPATTAASASAPAAASAVTKDLLLDNFEADLASNGQSWWSGCDTDKIGTTLDPQPFVAEKGGSPASPGRSGRIHGKLGTDSGHEPWPWASFALTLASPDISGYSAVSFYAKGDGGKYTIQLCKTAVKDFANYQAQFMAPKEWTKVTLKLSEFAQPSWGAPVAAVFTDVEKVQLNPTVGGAAYDFSIDDLTLVK